MNTKPVVVRKLPAILATALMVVPLTAVAQPAEAEKPDNRPSPQRGAAFSDRFMGTFPQGDLAALRVLTEEQRVSFREAMDAQRGQTRALEEKLRAARKEVVAAGLTEKFDEDAVRKKALEVGKIEAELSVLRARALFKVKPPLSAEQIEQIKNPPPFRAGGGQLRTVDGQLRIVPPRRPDRAPASPRDEHDLPAAPKPDK